MTQQPVHLMVEKGPDLGLEITVPPNGIRVGRSSNNDVVLKDPAMSRFHCRFYFKPGEGLWAEDLGSANQTLLNDKPLYESRIHVGDRLMMGDTMIKVVSDEFGPTAVQSLFGTLEAIRPWRQILFRRPPSGKPEINVRHIIIMILIPFAILVIAGVVFWSFRLMRYPVESNAILVEPSTETLVEIYYEKVQANSNNIFRYAMTLKNNEISIQIDDLQNRRHIAGTQMKKVELGLIQNLIDAIKHFNFFELKEEYKGLPAAVWDLWDLSLTIGKKTHRVKVLNTIEPQPFQSIRETIEEFGQNELGLAALALLPEKLLELAKSAALLGRSLYDQRQVKNDNLALAIRSLKEAEWYLETIEPKPDFYADAVALRGDCERELQETYENHRFLAERAIKLKDWPEAATQLRLICDKIPDRSDDRHASARKKLIDVERHLKKK